MYTELLPTGILLGASFFDMKSRKVPNYFVLVVFALAVLSVIFLNVENRAESLFGFLTAVLITLPLWFIQAMGAGDVKVFAVFGLLTSSQTVLDVFIFSLVIALLIGVTKTILEGHLKSFISNFKKIISLQKPEQKTLSKIPFTVALLLGWVCFLIQNHYGRIV